MKTRNLWLLATVALLPLDLLAQARSSEFQITKINKNFISNPQINYTGSHEYTTNLRDLWLEVEVEFAATPEATDELTFKYFILINGKLLTGEVTHVNILAGKDNRSVMYVPPKAIARVMNNRPANAASVQNIQVQILQKGTLKDEMSLVRAPAQWYSTMTALTGLVLNKNETPFGPLFWDRYEQIKSPPH